MQRKRQFIVLAMLLVVLGAVVVYEWPSATPQAVAARPARAAAGRPPAAKWTQVPSVRLDAVQAARSEPAPPAAARNPFTFQPKAPPPLPAGLHGAVGPGGAAGSAGGPGESAMPAAPPPPPPIPFKFIGVVQAPDRKLAVLMDAATRDVFYGREGDVIDGRYRILRIAVESIEMAYVDGRGRQTIRLTGA